ncbi:MAG: hypothetical protein Q9173_006330, partial [Seirophora scorigena]
MLHHKNPDKAKHYIDLLDTARCDGNWSELPELVRKVGKHAPQRKCLQLTAQAEHQEATASTGLSQIVLPLTTAIQEPNASPKDVFQARICLGSLYWTLKDPVLALQTLPEDIHAAYIDSNPEADQGRGWSSVCAVKGAYIRGDLQEKVNNVNEALRTYESILPHVESTLANGPLTPGYCAWAEKLLAQYCVLANRVVKSKSERGETPYTKATLAPFRLWADLLASQAKNQMQGVSTLISGNRAGSRRRVWQMYYETLSAVLRRGGPYPTLDRRPSTCAREMSTDNLKSLDNPMLQFILELRRVEGMYEDILHREVAFPRANRSNVEVEMWADQVVSNWRIISSPRWLNQDVGKGGKEMVTRDVLAVGLLVHSEFTLAEKALDTYVELVTKGKARVDKSGESESGLDDDATVLKTTGAGIQMLCYYGLRKQVEKAQEIAVSLESWLDKIQSSSERVANADDNPPDLRSEQRPPGRPVSGEALATAYHSLGVCYAHWARLTLKTSSRPELQAKAIVSFRAALNSYFSDSQSANTHYALALTLAETRDIDAAIVSVKQAISLCNVDNEGLAEHQQTATGGTLEDQDRKLLSKAWHLLSFLLAARQDFAMAIASCDAAEELYSDLLANSGQSRFSERLTLSERESIIELKMSQLVLCQILDGSEEAVNACGELLGTYKQLLAPVKAQTVQAPANVINSSKDTISPPPMANGSVKSARRSLLGRSKEALPRNGHHPNHVPITGETSPDLSRDTDIAMTLDGALAERKYQPPHHLARQESKKLHKRRSRKSMLSEQGTRSGSPHKPPRANGSEDSTQANPLRVANLKRSSLEASVDGSSVGHAADGISAAVTHNTSSGEKQSGGGPYGLPHAVSHSTHHKNQNAFHDCSNLPTSAVSMPSPTIALSSYPLPDPLYSPVDLGRRSLTLLTRIWLLVAQLYRDAGMSVDAQGALSEAFRYAQSIEAAVAAIESSAQALSTPGWGNVKSVAEVWADVHAEQGTLHLHLGDGKGASEEFEKALGWFPDHSTATVRLSNMLLDYYQMEDSAVVPTSPKKDSEAGPVLARLPPLGKAGSAKGESSNGRHEASPKLLSRLAARDRAYGLLSMLTKSGRGWDDSEAWSALARVYEQSGQIDKAKEALWWVVELEDSRPLREWSSIGETFEVDFCVNIHLSLRFSPSRAMSEKKRKRASHDAGQRPNKRAATLPSEPGLVEVSLIPEEDEWAPVIANTPGVSFPPNTSLTPYAKARKNDTSSTGKSLLSKSEHLLHTSSHAKIDYIAREEEGGGAGGLLQHYLGMYDPQSGQLQLVRARKLVLRGSVRPVPSPGEEAVNHTSDLSARNTLGLAFGTKKSQRAIDAITKNAISPSKQRSAPGHLDPIASAVVSSMAAPAPTRDELQAAVDESKPRPKPNLDAETPADVYPIEQLVGGPTTLAQMTVKGWQDTIDAGEEILTKSRFVSHRVQSIVKGGDVRRLKTLKYMLLLLEWYNALQTAPHKSSTRRVLPAEKLQQALTGWSSFVVDSVSRRFAEGSVLVRRWHLDLLITHICALALTVDGDGDGGAGFATNLHDLGQDLKLEIKDTKKYFREVGCQ